MADFVYGASYVFGCIAILVFGIWFVEMMFKLFPSLSAFMDRILDLSEEDWAEEDWAG